jgi:hypothetical protein
LSLDVEVPFLSTNSITIDGHFCFIVYLRVSSDVALAWTLFQAEWFSRRLTLKIEKEICQFQFQRCEHTELNRPGKEQKRKQPQSKNEKKILVDGARFELAPLS